MSFLGLDIGTGGCKAAAFDARGNLVALAFREYHVTQPEPGWAELDPKTVGDACLESMREVAEKSAKDPIEAMGISSQGEAFTALDAEGNPLINAMVSSDRRAAALMETWVARFGIGRLYEKTGHTAHPMFSLFKLLWLREHRPAVWKRAARFLCFEDYLHHRLGIDPGIGWPLAGRTMLFDGRKGAWDAEILAEAGVRPEQLARPLASGTVVGTIPDGMAQTLGLPNGVRVVAGGHDQVCAALGAGAVKAGRAALTTGTVECIAAAFAKPVLSAALRDANLCTYPHAAPGLFATLAYNLTGGNLLRWFRDEWGGPEREEAGRRGVDAYEVLLERMAPAPTNLLVLPYFTASGTPYFDAQTPGAILGLRFGVRRGEVLRALLDGLAFELRLNLTILQKAGIAIRELYAVGGGARSRIWLQLKADVLDRPIIRPRVTEAGCLGTALLASAAVTGRPVARLLEEWVAVEETFTPNRPWADLYAGQFQEYERAYAALAAWAAKKEK